MFLLGDQLRPETGVAASVFNFVCTYQIVSSLNDLFVQFVPVYSVSAQFVVAFMLASSVPVNESQLRASFTCRA